MGRLKTRRKLVLLRGAIIWFSWNLLNGRGIHWVHANPDRSCLLKTEVSWRNINGILIRTLNTQTFLHFRRFLR